VGGHGRRVATGAQDRAGRGALDLAVADGLGAVHEDVADADRIRRDPRRAAREIVDESRGLGADRRRIEDDEIRMRTGRDDAAAGAVPGVPARRAGAGVAAAAEAAAEAAVLPVEAQMTACAPRPAASLIATVIPRSLKEPVGFMPSNLTDSSKPPPSACAMRGTGRSGVSPSSSVTALVCSGISRYSP